MKIIVATKNLGKFKEISNFLSEHVPTLAFTSLLQKPDFQDIEETGSTFLENATLKAQAVASHFGVAALADDSGLVVDALDGRPGVYSARFAGPKATDSQNNQKLLRDLTNIPMSDRSAHFNCQMVLMFPDGKSIQAEGRVDGTILKSPRGTSGFGYDPLFQIEGRNETMAEISLDEKNRISHRANALKKLAEKILQRQSDA